MAQVGFEPRPVDHHSGALFYFTLPHQRRNINSFIKKIYFAYFGVPLSDQDKSWAPHQVCTTCLETLRSWSQGKNAKLKFDVPMVWREPKNHVDDCYFCLVNVKGFNKKTSNTCNTQTYILLWDRFPIVIKYLYPFSPSFRTLMRTSLGLPYLQPILMMMMKNRI